MEGNITGILDPNNHIGILCDIPTRCPTSLEVTLFILRRIITGIRLYLHTRAFRKVDNEHDIIIIFTNLGDESRAHNLN